MAKKIVIKGPIVSTSIWDFYDWLGWDASCAKVLKKSLEDAGGEDVEIELNSNGGLATEGFEMYKVLKDYEGKVTVHLINAMSAASFIVCAADETLASDAAILMIHNTQCSAEGDYRDMQMEADALREFNQSIINVYVRKTGMSREKLQEMMDNDTYMSPEKAIEYGFVDGYLYGDPNEKDDINQEGHKGMVVMNAAAPIISDEKAQELLALLVKERLNAETEIEKDDIGGDTGSHKKNQNEGGNVNMTLEEFLTENPEAKAEFDEKINAANEKGIANERERLCELDDISQSVTPEALNDAKYGENVMNAKDLAFQAMKDDKLRMKSYMTNTMEDSEDSGADDVGAGQDVDSEDNDESDEMANYANSKRRGGRRG